MLASCRVWESLAVLLASLPADNFTSVFVSQPDLPHKIKWGGTMHTALCYQKRGWVKMWNRFVTYSFQNISLEVFGIKWTTSSAGLRSCRDQYKTFSEGETTPGGWDPSSSGSVALPRNLKSVSLPSASREGAISSQSDGRSDRKESGPVAMPHLPCCPCNNYVEDSRGGPIGMRPNLVKWP